MVVRSLLLLAGLDAWGPDVAFQALDSAADKRISETVSKIRSRLRGLSRAIPKDRDLADTLRVAQLSASLCVIEECARREDLERVDTRGMPYSEFLHRAKIFLFQQLGLSLGMELIPNEELIGEIDKHLDQALSNDTKGNISNVLKQAATAAWDEIVGAVGEAPDNEFRSIFLGETAEPGWPAIFAALMREALSEKPREAYQFLTTRLADLRVHTSQLQQAIGIVRQTTGEVRDQVVAIRAIISSNTNIKEIEGFVDEVAERLTHDDNLDLHAKMDVIRDAVQLYCDEIAPSSRRKVLDADVEQAINRAHQLSSEGKSRLALASIRDAAARIRRDASAESDKYKAKIVVLYQKGRDLALATYNSSEAADVIVEKAMVENGDDKSLLFENLQRETESLIDSSRNTAGRAPLLCAVALCRRRIGIAETRLQRGYCWHDLGRALTILGERDPVTKHLEEAVSAYERAAEEWSRRRFFDLWLSCQINRAGVIADISARKGGVKDLESAAKEYEDLVMNIPLPSHQREWAAAAHNLANTLANIAGRRRDSEVMLRAIDYFRATLKIHTRHEDPIVWSKNLSNLASALCQFGEWTGETRAIREAIAIGTAALLERDQHKFPYEWAESFSARAHAQVALGIAEKKVDLLTDGIAGFRTVIEALDSDDPPFFRSRVLYSIGSSLFYRGWMTGSDKDLTEAIEAHNASINAMTRSEMPQRWAQSHYALGTAYYALGERTENIEALSAALRVYRVALEVWTEQLDARAHYQTVAQIAATTSLIGVLRNDAGPMREAAAAFERVEQFYSMKNMKAEHAKAVLGRLTTVSLSEELVHERGKEELRSELDRVEKSISPVSDELKRRVDDIRLRLCDSLKGPSSGS